MGPFTNSNSSEIFKFVLEIVDKLLPANKVVGVYVAYLNTAYGASVKNLLLFENVASGLIPLGILLLSLHWASSLLTEVLSKDFDIEILIRSLIKLAIGAIIVSNSLEIFKGVATFVDALYTDITKAATITTGLTQVNTELTNYETQLDAKATATALYGILQSIVMYIVNSCIGFVIPISLMIHGLTRKVELVQLFVYAPIGISDIYEGGMNSGGIQYIRKFFAVSMEALIIYIILLLYGFISTSTAFASPGAWAIWAQVIAVFATVGWIRKARSFSKQIFC